MSEQQTETKPPEASNDGAGNANPPSPPVAAAEPEPPKKLNALELLLEMRATLTEIKEQTDWMRRRFG